MKHLLKRRKELLKRESIILGRRIEIFKMDDPSQEELDRLVIESRSLFNDWWTLRRDYLDLPIWKQVLFSFVKDL